MIKMRLQIFRRAGEPLIVFSTGPHKLRVAGDRKFHIEYDPRSGTAFRLRHDARQRLARFVERGTVL